MNPSFGALHCYDLSRLTTLFHAYLYSEEVQISRCVLDKNTLFKEEPLQLHVFCDASITAYAATVYIRQPICQGHFRSKLLETKSRVLPVKTICAARLELSALLGAQLVHSISNASKTKDF